MIQRVFLLPMIALALAATAEMACAQDAAQVSPKTTTVIFENEYIRVIRATFAKGDSEPTHTHPPGWYYVTEGGTLTVKSADGKTVIWQPKAGENAWEPGEAPHTATNTGVTPLEYLYVEVKAAKAP